MAPSVLIILPLSVKVSTQIWEIFLHSILLHIKLFVNLTHAWLELIKVFFTKVFINLKYCKHFLCILPFIFCKPRQQMTAQQLQQSLGRTISQKITNLHLR